MFPFSFASGFLCSKKPSEVAGKRVAMFSYGSGLASSIYCLRITSDVSADSPLSAMMSKLADVKERLQSRKRLSPAEFEAVMKLREETHHKASYKPVSSPSDLFPGTYYLTFVDDMYRRTYERVPPTVVGSKSPPLLSPAKLATMNGK